MALEELDDSMYLSRFNGSNPTRWICDVERFFSFYEIYGEERFPYVVEYFDDEPFSWFNSWYRGPERLTWKSFTIAMLHRFHTATTSNNIYPSPPSLQPINHVQPSSLPCHEPPIPLTPTPLPKQSLLGSINPQAAILSNKTSIPVIYPFVLLDGHVSLKNRCSKLNVVDPNAIGRREWRPPWLPTCRYVETAPNVMVRLEWRPPWIGSPSLRTRTFFRAGVLIRARRTKTVILNWSHKFTCCANFMAIERPLHLIGYMHDLHNCIQFPMFHLFSFPCFIYFQVYRNCSARSFSSC